MIEHPDVVRISFEWLGMPEKDELIAVVRTLDGGSVTAGGLPVVHQWLTDHSYQYMPATNGLWVRISARQRRKDDDGFRQAARRT